MLLPRLLLLASCAMLAVGALPSPYRRTPHGVEVTTAAGVTVSVSVASGSSFRLGVRLDGAASSALSSPSLSLSPPASHSVVTWGDFTGVSTAFGALVATPSGEWTLQDADNHTLVAGSTPAAASVSGDSGVQLPVHGSALGPSQPCLGNGLFGAPFFWTEDNGFLAMAVSEWQQDPAHPHCYPVTFNGISTAPDATLDDFCDASHAITGYDVTNPQRAHNFPDGTSVSDHGACCAACHSDSTCVAWVFADSNPSQGQNCWPLAGYSSLTPSASRTFGGAKAPKAWWWAMGAAADWYLAPAATAAAYTTAYAGLTGPVSLPPYYGMGFLASYWGYGSYQDIYSNFTAFRTGDFPVDVRINDYGWWRGQEMDDDFNYTASFWCLDAPCQLADGTVSGPVEVFKYEQQHMHLRWMGIRKPRTYSNVAFCNSSGWLLPPQYAVGAGGNNLNFTRSDMRAWYTKNHLHFLTDAGPSNLAWWNDEGETEWFTYTYWNAAQTQQWAAVAPTVRLFTINRSYQPGLHRVPGVTWTGDRQACDHATVLGFITNGQAWVACDMTSPSATILARQYQNAVFLPFMRVHQMHGTPRFPFLWGDEAAGAMRRALNLRYAFIPYLYSLFHHSRSAPFMPPMRPASWTHGAGWEQTYEVGGTVYPVDVCTANSASDAENTTSIRLPPGTYFEFNSTTTVTGNRTITRTDVPIDTFDVYVAAGSLLTLQRDVVQYTDAMGGVLMVHVYAGGDATFDLVEDDGDTTAYKSGGDAATRVTSFKWLDASRTLTWAVSGGFTTGSRLFTSVQAVLFHAKASAPQPSGAARPLAPSGTIAFGSGRVVVA